MSDVDLPTGWGEWGRDCLDFGRYDSPDRHSVIFVFSDYVARFVSNTASICLFYLSDCKIGAPRLQKRMVVRLETDDARLHTLECFERLFH